jgi:pyrroloquinoline-quinone synthase
MSFAENLLTEDIVQLRQKLLNHPLWARIEAGTLEIERLRLFALQDWWLVRQAYRLDALAIANVTDLSVQELLIGKLLPKVGGYTHLITFGTALGLSSHDFGHVEPVAGCMALTNFFYWMLTYGTPEEKLAAVSASEDIFIQICARIGPALIHHYQMTEEQITFFTLHEDIASHVNPIDNVLIERYTRPDEQHRIIQAIRLSHEFELLFYDTIVNSPLD